MEPAPVSRLGVYPWLIRSRDALALTMLCSLAAGCPSLQSRSAGHIGCSPDEIRISDSRREMGWSSSTRTWVARCRGRLYRCSAESAEHSTATHCTLETSGGTVAADIEPSRAAEPPSPAERTAPTEAEVRRSVGPDGVVEITATITTGSMYVEIVAQPLAAPDEMMFAVRGPSRLGGATCQVRLMVDGQLLPVRQLAFQPVGDGGRWRVMMETAQVRAAADASRVVGRICDQELRFDEAARRMLAELVHRYDEERTFAGTASSP